MSNNPTYSDYYPVEYSTLQGSCLGSLLFMVFVNDLYEQLQHCKCILFADDTTIYICHNNLRYMKWSVEEDLSVLSNWFKANKLTLNSGKSVGLLFNPTNKKSTTELDIKIEGQTIPMVNETKFLGVWIDSKLDWKIHTDKVLLKIKCNMNLLQQSKNLLPLHAKKILYHAQIHSHISYGLLVWGPMCSKQILKKLQSMQNQCLKLITNKKHLEPHTWKSLGIPNISNLIKLTLCKTGYKLLKKDFPVRIIYCLYTDKNNLSLSRNHAYNTWQKHIPRYSKSNLAKYPNSFLHQCIKQYSTLSVATHGKPTVQLFVSAL